MNTELNGSEKYQARVERGLLFSGLSRLSVAESRFKIRGCVVGSSALFSLQR